MEPVILTDYSFYSNIMSYLRTNVRFIIEIGRLSKSINANTWHFLIQNSKRYNVTVMPSKYMYFRVKYENVSFVKLSFLITDWVPHFINHCKNGSLNSIKIYEEENVLGKIVDSFTKKEYDEIFLDFITKNACEKSIDILAKYIVKPNLFFLDLIGNNDYTNVKKLTQSKSQRKLHYNISKPQFYTSDAFTHACVKNRTEMVKLFIELGYTWNKYTLKNAFYHESLEVCKLLIESGCPFDPSDIPAKRNTRNQEFADYIEQILSVFS